MPTPKTPTFDWCTGYRACLKDFETIAASRFAAGDFGTRSRDAISSLIADLRSDERVIHHAELNRVQRAAAAKSAQ